MLNVAGAYHSRLMETAYQKFGAVLQQVSMEAPRFSVISNVTGEDVKTPAEIRRTLQDQITGTVRWLDCMQRLAALECDFLIELGPGGVLAGLFAGTQTFSVRQQTLAIADALTDAPSAIFNAPLPLSTALVVGGLVLLLTVVIAIRRLTRIEIAGSEAA